MHERDIVIPTPVKFLPKQLDVFQACRDFDCVLYSGAFRAGKTLLLANVALQNCIDNPGSVGLLGGTGDAQVHDVVLGTFEDQASRYQNALSNALSEFNDDYKILSYVNHSSGKMEAGFTNGSKIFFRSCDEERKLAGRTIDFFGLDEAVDMDEKIFKQLIARKSGTGNHPHRFGLITTNPGAESHWLYNYFFIQNNVSYKVVETTTYENILLPDYEKYVSDLEAIYDEDWVRRYLNGQWGAFSGQIFKDFIVNRHVVPCQNKKMQYYIAGIDWGLRHPFCILTIGISEDDKAYVVKENYGNDKTSHELSKEISELHKHYHYRRVYVDPAAADLIKQCHELGVPCGKVSDTIVKSYANNDVQNGISHVRSLLKNNCLFVDRSCFNLIKQFQSYRYDRDSEKPVKKDDDCVDSCRYGLTDFRPLRKKAQFGAVFWRSTL